MSNVDTFESLQLELTGQSAHSAHKTVNNTVNTLEVSGFIFDLNDTDDQDVLLHCAEQDFYITDADGRVLQ